MRYPTNRLRRLRINPAMRSLVRENSLSPSDLVLPLFAVEGTGVRREIPSIPGNFHLSVDEIVDEAKTIRDLGVRGVIVFGVPDSKDDSGKLAYSTTGITQRALRAIKSSVDDIVVMSDICLCEFTTHGHCGIIRDNYVQNDETVEIIGKIGLSHAEAGADIVAPAAMMDGQIGAIRSILEGNGHHNVGIMAYSAKYWTKLYDPFFKDGTGSSVAFGDKKTHQMDYGNSNEALREMRLDIEEGADILMVKPGLFYLDIVFRAKNELEYPLAVYNVSGEYAMINAGHEAGVIDRKQIIIELLTSYKRAGADIILTYAAKDAAKWLCSS